MVCRGHQVRETFLPGDPPDEHGNRAIQIHAQLGEDRPRSGDRLGWINRMPRGGVDSVAHHMDPARVQIGVGRHDVFAHPAADRDDGVSGVYRRVFHPRGHPVPAAELFGLPRATGLQGMCGQNVWDAMQQLGQVSGQARVPGV